MAATERIEFNHDKEPVRLFKSDLLESLSHIHPVVVLLIYVPIVAILLFLTGKGYVEGDFASPWHIPAALVLGLFLWSMAEYSIHRFVFHFRPRTAWQQQLSFLFHGIHHYQPQCKTRLVMPPAASIPLALLFYLLFYLVLDSLLVLPEWIAPAFAGFIAGYLAYDMLHYSTHHIPMRRGVWKALKRHHMRHHYKTPNKRFGVSSPLWDVIFGTLPPSQEPDPSH